MLLKKSEKKNWPVTIAVIFIGLFLLGFVYFYNLKREESPVVADNNPSLMQPSGTGVPSEKDLDTVIVKGDIVMTPAIDYKDLTTDTELTQLMTQRKEVLGIKKSLDMIVRSDETFKIGDIQISMRDILEKAFVTEGSVFEEKIDPSGAVMPKKIKEYGIYVVQPGDNLWNIHFNILKEYYDFKGIKVSPMADEPVDKGLSSGIGKILKFSETDAIIYNLVEKKVDTNIDLLEPLSKIVIYNLDEVFTLLQEITYENIDRIQFDGRTIWIPARKS